MPLTRQTIVGLSIGVAVALGATTGIIALSGRETPADMLADAKALLTGDGVHRDVNKAIRLFEKVAMSQDRANAREAALDLVSHFEQQLSDGGGDASKEASVQLWRLRAAECGHRDSAEHLLRNLVDQVPLPEQAERVARAGAGAGSPYCMLVLGDLLKEGRGTVKQDLPGAREWYRKADDAGEPRGNARLAMMLLSDPSQQAECLTRLIRAGEGGDAECAYQAALRLLGNHGVEPDVAKAVELLQRGVDASHAKACFELARLLEDGVRVPQDLPKARALQQVAAGEDAGARFAYAQMCELGIGGPVDVPTAMHYYTLAAKSGLLGAHLRMGVLCHEGRPGFEPNPVEAERHLRAAAESGDSTAQWRLSRVLVESGRSSDEAAELSAKAAKAGVPGAIYDQYWFLLKGSATQPPDRIAAIESLRAATEQNFPEAWYRWGILLADGDQGVVGNTKDAAEAFEKAIELGVPMGALQMGALFYEKGLNAPPDFVAAAKQFRYAAEHGITDAQVAYGLRCERGDGVPADEREAYRWYVLASAEGNQFAISRRNFLRNRMLNQNWQQLEDAAVNLLVVDAAKAKFNREQVWSPLDRRGGRSAQGKPEGFFRPGAAPAEAPVGGGSRKRSVGPQPKGNRSN